MSGDFEPDLGWSHTIAGMPFWDDIYRQAFPGFVASHIPEGDGWHQRAGRDRIIVLDDSTTITIDEKGRRDKWPDILIEIQHDRDRNIPGWGHPDKRLGCDYIGYAFVPTQVVHLIPYRELRRVMENGPGRDWWRVAARAQQDGTRAAPIKFVDARNPRDTNRPVKYWTRSLAVPPNILLAAIRDSLTFSFEVANSKAPTVELPEVPARPDPKAKIEAELAAAEPPFDPDYVADYGWPEVRRPFDWSEGAA